MLDEEQRKHKQMVMGSLLQRQEQLGTDDPFQMMKQLTETFKAPS